MINLELPDVINQMMGQMYKANCTVKIKVMYMIILVDIQCRFVINVKYFPDADFCLAFPLQLQFVKS